jgi:hypothetical protein
MAAKQKASPARRKREAALDEEVEESFPASDPPAFSAGTLGAPKQRHTPKKPPATKTKPAKKKNRK